MDVGNIAFSFCAYLLKSDYIKCFSLWIGDGVKIGIVVFVFCTVFRLGQKTCFYVLILKYLSSGYQFIQLCTKKKMSFSFFDLKGYWLFLVCRLSCQSNLCNLSILWHFFPLNNEYRLSKLFEEMLQSMIWLLICPFCVIQLFLNRVFCKVCGTSTSY